MEAIDGSTLRDLPCPGADLVWVGKSLKGGIVLPIMLLRLQVANMIKESACNAKKPGFDPELGKTLEKGT